MHLNQTFKNFIIESTTGSFSWFGDRWTKQNIGDRPIVGIYIDSKRVSVDHASPYHPNIKKSLKILLRQFPDVAGRKLDFDGYSPGTVAQFLRSSEPIRPQGKLPKYLFTGTSLYRWESIKEQGLKPRVETGVDAAYGAKIATAKPANPHYIYLAGSFGAITRFAAGDASSEKEDFPVILRINTSGLDYNLLRPDEDSRTESWEESLRVLNTLAYEGSIEPQYIELYKVRNPETKEWEDKKEIVPSDWLGKQMFNKKNYTPIPNSTAQYKWIKPND